MTALQEVSKFHNGMKGVFSPLIVEQVLLTWHYLFVSGTKMGGVKYVIAHFPSSCAIVRWICPGKKHLFTK